MKKVIILLIVFVYASICYSQTKKEVFDYSVNYINYKVNEWSLFNSYQTENDTVLKRKKRMIHSEYKRNFDTLIINNILALKIKEYLEDEKYNKNIEFYNIINKYKGLFEKEYTQEKIKEILLKDFFEDKDVKIILDQTFSEIPNNEKYLKEIKLNVSKIINFYNKPNKIITSKGNNKNETDFIMDIFILLIIAILTFVFYKKITNLKKQGNVNNLDALNKEFISEFNEFQIKYESMSNSLSSRIELLENEINTLKGLSNTVVNFNEEKNILEPETAPDVYISKLFFPAPLEDGYFDAHDAEEEHRESISFYEFNLFDENNAIFDFANKNENLQRILDGKDDFIIPVCDIENPFAKANDFKILKKGKVQKQGDMWKVIEKIQIKYV